MKKESMKGAITHSSLEKSVSKKASKKNINLSMPFATFKEGLVDYSISEFVETIKMQMPATNSTNYGHLDYASPKDKFWKETIGKVLLNQGIEFDLLLEFVWEIQANFGFDLLTLLTDRSKDSNNYIALYVLDSDGVPIQQVDSKIITEYLIRISDGGRAHHTIDKNRPIWADRFK